MDIDKKILIKIVILIFCVIAGFYSTRIYQNKVRTFEIYKNALKDYNNNNFQNSFYLFSKIGHISNLKPAALYRQAMSANAIGDKKSELNCYLTIVKQYPASRLAPESKYKAAQILLNKNPQEAQRLFTQISKSDMDKDYVLASNAYLSEIKENEIIQKSASPSKRELDLIENGYREYLKYAPNGRLAIKISKLWMAINKNITPTDKTLIAKAYYYAGLYSEAEEIFKTADIKNSWAIRVSNHIALNNISEANNLIELGVSQYSKTVSTKEYEKAVYDLLKTKSNYFSYASRLLQVAEKENKDIIWNLKCKYSPKTEQNSCYSSLYANYPQSKYAPDALLSLMMNNIVSKNYQDAKKIANDFTTKFPDSKHIPMIKFWLAKIEQKYGNSDSANLTYKQIINTYPETYYAYRSFWMLEHFNNSVINTRLNPKKIVFPIKTTDKVLSDLLSLKDYEMIEKYTKDEFVKSWVQYKNKEYTKSVYTAQKAMEKLPHKPDKKDVRWRLVYPLNYYKTIEHYADMYGNNIALMLAITREESHFDQKAGSSVGAMGLMQLMPQTAQDICNKNGLIFTTSELYTPDVNIKLGNLYYKTIYSLLNNLDISAIAAYNGGIGSVKKWKTSILYSDTDEFVEQIPYDETKEYVKKVFKSYWNYMRIYQ